MTTRDAGAIPFLTDEDFLTVLDGMIESTEEFIADDQLTRDDDAEGRFADLDALNHVRDLYTDVFMEG